MNNKLKRNFHMDDIKFSYLVEIGLRWLRLMMESPTILSTK